MVIPLLLRILIIGIHGTHRHVHGNSKMHSWMPLGEEIPQALVQINYWYLQLSVFWRGVSSCQQSWKCSTNQLKVLTGLHGGHNLIGNWTISSSKLWFANNTKMQQAIFDVWWVDQEPTLITKLQLRGFLMSRACTMLMLEARKRHETKTWAPLSLLTLESWTATDVGQSDKRLTWKKTLKKLIS